MAKDNKEPPKITEQQRALATGFARGMMKSIHGRFGPERAAQVLNAMKGLADAVSPDTASPPVDPNQAELDELQQLANAGELAELVSVTEDQVDPELRQLVDAINTEDSSKENS